MYGGYAASTPAQKLNPPSAGYRFRARRRRRSARRPTTGRGCHDRPRSEAERLTDESESLENPIWRLCQADLVRILSEQHRYVDGGTRFLRRKLLDLAFVD